MGWNESLDFSLLWIPRVLNTVGVCYCKNNLHTAWKLTFLSPPLPLKLHWDPRTDRGHRRSCSVKTASRYERHFNLKHLRFMARLISCSTCCLCCGLIPIGVTLFNGVFQMNENTFCSVIWDQTNAAIFCPAWLVLQTDQRAPGISVYRGCQAEAKSSPPWFHRPLRYWMNT